MIARLAKIELRLPQSHSLKDKRKIAKSLIDRLHRRHRIAVAEVAQQDRHQVLVLGLACVSTQAGLAERVLDQVLDLVEDDYEVQLIAVDEEEVSL